MTYAPCLMSSFAEKIKRFNRSLRIDAVLPAGVSVLHPFREGQPALQCADAFYDKYYNDELPRHAILGINPGRFGGGITGVPFTDFRRLEMVCGIEFIYRMIGDLGGPADFYRRFYINSVCPLGFVIQNTSGRWVNYNYYDDQALYDSVRPFIIQSIRGQIALGLSRDWCVCLGKRNFTFLTALNREEQFFDEIREVPHPRFIVQYKRKQMDQYIEEYRVALSL